MEPEQQLGRIMLHFEKHNDIYSRKFPITEEMWIASLMVKFSLFQGQAATNVIHQKVS